MNKSLFLALIAGALGGIIPAVAAQRLTLTQESLEVVDFSEVRRTSPDLRDRVEVCYKKANNVEAFQACMDLNPIIQTRYFLDANTYRRDPVDWGFCDKNEVMLIGDDINPCDR